MGLDDEDGYDDGLTSQDVYYSRLASLKAHGPQDMYESMRAGGPPPPEPGDGYWGKFRFYTHHAKNKPEYARLLDELGPPPE
ncbi:hypothetical protein [Nocardia sp. alder85J]|uniref:hypothetical protein n=1 Tax=Nocardia sp. alder85J TaxID=2862949 RepID=UPI001CD3CA79|nr:hypothetical protein [Nocardia sp. alder85J]MCX4095333.1 hypothetical protein [Nocardia sp. alder85J]